MIGIKFEQRKIKKDRTKTVRRKCHSNLTIFTFTQIDSCLQSLPELPDISIYLYFKHLCGALMLFQRLLSGKQKYKNKIFNYNALKRGKFNVRFGLRGLGKQAVRSCCPGQPWGGWLIRDH